MLEDALTRNIPISNVLLLAFFVSVIIPNDLIKESSKLRSTSPPYDSSDIELQKTTHCIWNNVFASELARCFIGYITRLCGILQLGPLSQWKWGVGIDRTGRCCSYLSDRDCNEQCMVVVVFNYLMSCFLVNDIGSFHFNRYSTQSMHVKNIIWRSFCTTYYADLA
jgi:hypothetical protein